MCEFTNTPSFRTVDSLVGKLKALFSETEQGGDMRLPAYGNPAFSQAVHCYVKMVREEQLNA